MANPSPKPRHGQFPDALRSVLGSHQKLGLLCLLDDGPRTAKELSTALEGTMRPQAINLHLDELSRLGWVRVAGGEKHNPYDPLRWGLATEPRWRQLARLINANAPTLDDE